MSTKIYNGFKIQFDNFVHLNEIFKEYRKEMQEFVVEEYRKRVIRIATNLYDRREFKDSPFYDAIDKLKSSDLFDYELSFVIIPTSNTSALGIYFTGWDWGPILPNKFWFDKPFVQEYGYWDNTDPLPGLSEEDWNVVGDGPMNHYGLVIELIDSKCRPFDFWKGKKTMSQLYGKYIPTVEERKEMNPNCEIKENITFENLFEK